MSTIPPPADRDRPVARLIQELDAFVGRRRFVEVCVDLLDGADRTAYVPELRYLTGFDWSEGAPAYDVGVWKAYWVRTWGARGLLYCWDDEATRAVVAGLGDEHYRPAEMCLKVAAKHDVAGSGPGAAALTRHELPRVRANAARALGVVGDTEHVADVRALLDDPEEWVREHAARAYGRMSRRLDLGDR
ncbi:MAG TPA: HEAT repeat domain-containing protein [Nocardioides sp.]|uniref:HEAT repeat domain-containing protein n=1 Tax=Nocardioides sp. TaxID=35761 RepID=UPI002F41122D